MDRRDREGSRSWGWRRSCRWWPATTSAITPPNGPGLGLFGDLDLLHRLGDRPPFAEQPLDFPQLAHDLLRRVPASFYRDV